MKFKEFLTSKSVEDITKLSAEEQAGLYNEYNDIKNKELEAAVAGKASKEDLDAMKAEIFENQEKQMAALNTALKSQGAILKRMSKEEVEAKNKSFADSLRAELVAKKESLKELKEGDKSTARNASFVVKVVGDITSANISGGNVPVEDRLSGFDVIPTRATRLLDVVSRSTTNSNIVSWVSQANKEGAAGQTAEGTAKNQIDFDLVVDSESLKKTTAYIKVSTEMIDDVDFIMAEIRNELLRELLLAVETQVYSGDNTGQNLNGIRTQAPAFAAGTFAGTIDNANEVDVLTVAMNQIEIAEQGEPTAIFMHPSDVNALKMVKVSSTDKRYVERLVMVAGNLELDGVPIIKSTLVTAGTYLVGNFANATVIQKAGVMIDIGLDGNDFTKNMRTILAEWRGLNLIKTNKVTSFVKGTFATDKAALETT